MPKIITVPNQQIVTVHRTPVKYDFLQISNENWQKALKDLEPYTFQLYLYFACNADKYTFALSPAAIKASIGMPRSTFYKKRDILIEKGYLTESGNHYHFYETPQEKIKPTVLTSPLTESGSFSF